MTYIVAWTLVQAQHAARHVLKTEPFVWVNNAERLRGLQRGTEIVFVDAPRYRAGYNERKERLAIRLTVAAREMKIKEVTLP